MGIGPVKNGDVAWIEGYPGNQVLKFATQPILVSSVDGTKLIAGYLMKTSDSNTVYLASADGKRYSFSDEGPFFSWYGSFNAVRTVSRETVAAMPLSGAVLYRPGSHLLRTASSSSVYIESKDGTLRPIANADVAQTLYGSSWQNLIAIIDETSFANYHLGALVTDANRYYAAIAK